MARFQLEALEGGQIRRQFDKPVRQVVDIRDLTAGMDAGYESFFLARWDEAIKSWRSVPTTVHQADGLLSAEINHFSELVGWGQPHPLDAVLGSPGRV